jgi:archaellum biogenesis ATPase FlaH
LSENIQNFIVKGLVENKDYFRKVISNLQPEYFDELHAPMVKLVLKYYAKYQNVPTYDIIHNALSKSATLSDSQKKSVDGVIKTMRGIEVHGDDWLFDNTKDFVNSKAAEKVMWEGASMLNGEKPKDFSAILKMMQDAVSINWNVNLGIRYSDLIMFDILYERLSDTCQRMSTGNRKLDMVLKGGIPANFTFLGVIAGSAGLGKTLFLQNLAVNALKQGKNVLYITLEISEQELRKRFDSCVTGLSIENIIELRAEVRNRIKEIYEAGKTGEMFIKEYPPSSITAQDVETYISNLKLHEKFVPDLIVIDYLGIMRPMTNRKNANSYERTKEVCEEIRALSGRHKIPILSAAQLNRGGYGDEAGLDNIADSMGVAHTADLVIGLTQSDTLKENDSVRYEILKSRISKTGPYGIIKVDYDKLKILDEDDEADADKAKIAKVIATKKKVVDKQEDSDKIEDSSGTVGGLT